MREGLEAFDSKMGQISEKMEELIKLERQARDLVNLLKNEMVKDVQEVKLPGVTITETPSGGCFAIVKFGELKLDNWSPRTYIPREQAKAVVEELENCTTVDGICKRVGKMLEKVAILCKDVNIVFTVSADVEELPVKVRAYIK